MLMKLQAPKAGKTLLQAKDSNILVQKQSQTVFMSLSADIFRPCAPRDPE